MASITEDDVEDITMDGDKDDDETTITTKHPKSKNQFLIFTHVSSHSQTKSKTSLIQKIY